MKLKKLLNDGRKEGAQLVNNLSTFKEHLGGTDYFLGFRSYDKESDKCRRGFTGLSLADLDNLPDPDVWADEIAENLESPFGSFQEVLRRYKKLFNSHTASKIKFPSIPNFSWAAFKKGTSGSRLPFSI